MSDENNIVVERRASLFAKACGASLICSPLFLGIAFLSIPERRNRIIIMVIAFQIVCLFGRWFAKKQRITLAINTLLYGTGLVITPMVYLSGRTGPTVWFYLGLMGISLFHVDAKQPIKNFVFLMLCILGVWPFVRVTDPVQLPCLISLMVYSVSMSYFNIRITNQNFDDINEARKQAETANQAKSVFLATMTHELRTPLNAVIGYAELMREEAEDGLLDAESAAKDLANIESSGRQLLGLISDVIDIVKLESGQIEVHPQELNLHALFSDLEVLMAEAAREKNLDLEFILPPAPSPTFHTDVMRLKKVLINLLSNAVKFTHEGSVQVEAEWTGEGTSPALSIQVRDTGVGIPKEHQEKIFELFSQVDGSYTREVDGAGLGLALVMRLVDRLDGGLDVESVPGEGSAFTLHLPCLGGECTSSITSADFVPALS